MREGETLPCEASARPHHQIPTGDRLMRYELIIYWSKADASFVVEVPELPGCMADGATYEEAVANAQAVIAEWIETARDRKSTRLNSSHGYISYAVFCLKKKKQKPTVRP